MLVFVIYYLFEFGFELSEFDIVAGFHTEDGSTQNQQLTHNGDGRAGNLTQGRNPEQTHGCYDDPAAEAGNRYDSLQFGEFYALFLGHGSNLLMVITLRLIVIDISPGLRLFSISDKEREDERVVAGALKA